MRGFLAVSVGPRADDAFRRPISAAVQCLRDGDLDHLTEVTDNGWAAFLGPEAADQIAGPGEPFAIGLSQAMRTRESDVSLAEVAQLVAKGDGLTALVPPFAAAFRAEPGGPVVLAGDWLGFRQLYWWQGAGVAAVSTSARALAVLAGGRWDLVGLGTQAMIGWHVGDTTIYEGVRAFPPASIATLSDGVAELTRYAPPPRWDGRPPALDDAVAEMADLLVDWQRNYLTDHPSTVLQLTGGHDSRILLAAVPSELRPGLRAMTLGEADAADVVIASQLATLCGLEHKRDHFEGQWPTPAEAHDLVMYAARGLDCLASPLALGPLLLVEAHLDQGHRLSGLGGEVARGFYYTGQPRQATTSPQLIERLARWRLFSNEAVAADVFEPDFIEQARAATLERLQTVFPSGDWLRSTDDFYLLNRMHRWGGVHGTVAAVRRHTINPMFDRRFIELALAVEPQDKRDSHLLGRLMTRLDPTLARIPLDSGLVPAQLAQRSLSTRVALQSVTARKVVRKVRQRVIGARKPQFGASQAADLVLAHWRAEPAACAALYRVPVLRSSWVDGLIAGHHGADPTTLAFLVNMVAAHTDTAATQPALH